MSNQAKEAKRLLNDLCPLVDLVREMLGAARHAFNRHSKAELEKLARLHTEFTLKIDPFFQRVEKELGKSSPGAPEWQQLKEVLSRLEFLAYEISRLSEPLQQKANRGAILADAQLFQVNEAFSRLTGLMRALTDTLKTGDPTLTTYLQREGERLREECLGNQTTLEARMMDSPGQPGAWSVYITILERFRDCLAHLCALAKSLG